jgi:hypothetical protein
MYANADAFRDPASALRASGYDLSGRGALVDPHGQVVALAKTGGLITLARWELKPRETLFRFGDSSRSPKQIVGGSWWLHKREFERLANFAILQRVSIGMALRVLCLVPPEWSDAGVLIRARVNHHLLAWRGLANSVVTPMKDSKDMVRMAHHNDVSERRLHQLFIPGIDRPGPVDPWVSIEHVFRIDPAQSVRGWLYL